MKRIADPIETEQEDDGRWIAELTGVPGVMCYGATREDSVRNVQELYRWVLADRIENGAKQAKRIGPA